MTRSEFMTCPPVIAAPTSLRDAIVWLGGEVKRRGDADLLLKLGAVQGLYRMYERTGDKGVLESLTTEVIVLVGSLVAGTTPVSEAEYLDRFTKRKTDLIYAQTLSRVAEDVTTADLINDFLSTLNNSENTRNNYRAALRRVLLKERELHHVKEGVAELVAVLDEILCESHTNHNINSAVRRFREYLQERYQ